MTDPGRPDPLVVFDLRAGRVGGLTFCRIVEGWFGPEQSFMIDNDVDKALDDWRALPDVRRRDMRFIWGHRFSSFQQRAPLAGPVRIVGLVRHPLLKVSGVDVRSADRLDALSGLSLEREVEDYRGEAGPLPSGSVEAFLDGHFMLGVTECMEDSLALLRSMLGVRAPLPPWERIGAHANLDDNLYSHALLKALVERPWYGREMGYYRFARRRLARDLHALSRRERRELAHYKAECAGRDPTLAKWRAAYPEVSAPVAGWPARPPRLRRRTPPSRIVPDAPTWTLRLGRGEAELPCAAVADALERDVLAPVWTFRLHHERAPWPPNVLRVELELPPIAAEGRWIYGMLAGRQLFQLHLGGDARTHAVEMPLGPDLEEVALVFNQYRESGGRRLYARVRRLQLLRAPLDGMR